MLDIAGGILIAAAVIAFVQSRAGATLVALLIVAGVLWALYALWGWVPICLFGLLVAFTVAISWHENRKVQARIAVGRTIHSQYKGDEP